MRVLTDEVPVEAVGGPLDGETVTVPWGQGLVRVVDAVAHITYHYRWQVEDDGSHFLLYQGTRPA